MKRIYLILTISFIVLSCGKSNIDRKSEEIYPKLRTKVTKDYVVLSNSKLLNAPYWEDVIEILKERHNADVYTFSKHPKESFNVLRTIQPRYVAVVDLPENIGAGYVADLHRLSSKIDEDIYTDFLWGIVTGYDGKNALEIIKSSGNGIKINKALSTTSENIDPRMFDEFAYISDANEGQWGEKKSGIMKQSKVPSNGILPLFMELYKKIEPDMLITSSHADMNTLEMPFSKGRLIAKGGLVYAELPNESVALHKSTKNKVFLPIGNCSIGNLDYRNTSMMASLFNTALVASAVGYVVDTWHGRAGWGGMKYWLATPGRYTLNEAFYLNRQDIIFRMNEWSKNFYKVNPPIYDDFSRMMSDLKKEISSKTGIRNATDEQIGFTYDRDILALYGDPALDVRLNQIYEENDFSVEEVYEESLLTINIKTFGNFSKQRIEGRNFKNEIIKELPFSHFFSKKVRNPILMNKELKRVALDENCIIIYNMDLKPNSTYTLKIKFNN